MMSSNMAAEADSSCSPEISDDSRKRPLDGEHENGTTKKTNYGGYDSVFHLKLLIPSFSAEAIIGKGGDKIAQLQKDTGAKINMSKSNDYYPGGMLVNGGIGGNSLNLSLNFGNPAGGLASATLTARLLDHIKVIQRDVNCCEKACEMIIAKIVEDPLSGSCLCTSYAHFTGPVANNSPTGSPFASLGWHRPSGSFGSTASLNSGGSGMLVNDGIGGNSLNLSLNFGNPAGGLASATLTARLLDHIKVIQRESGYSDQATTEITAAMRTLAQYGILGMGLGLTGSGNGHPLSNRGMHSNGIGNSNVFGPLGVVSGGSSLDSYKKDTDEEKKTDMEIAENIVGAILGPGGRSLLEIQHLSGANIQISKKGIYAPGTNNRIVSIVGSPNAIATAQYLIEQRISEEEAKRAGQTSLGLMQ
ncbi:hypothetical protein C0J52_25290 [Blattella germanica]|nr:hypothetical protein C0J52_25290 [Blattella germanica]